MRKQTLALVAMLFIANIAGSQEKIIFNSDRDIYIGGEDLWLSVINNDRETSLSKVVYIELLNKYNTPVVQEKLFLENNLASSRFTIPDTISTGNYLLRAYTSWMRNYSPECYTHQVISVINPFVDNALKNLKVKSDNRIEGELVNKTSAQVIKGLKKNYTQRQKVSLEIAQNNDWEYVTVSVTRSGLTKSNKQSAIDNIVYKIRSYTKLPEPKGEIISGVISNIETGEPIINEKMMLSFIDETAILKFSTTDSTGRFAFVINRFGVEEMVIQPYSSDTTKLNYKVTLDDQFSSEYANLEIPELVIDSTKLEHINSAIVNMQINTIYSDYLANVAKADSIEKAEAFYGKPERTTIIDKFIDLPTTEEVVREIVPFATLKRQKGQYIFRTYEDNSLYPRDGKTMPFVDGVPVYDVNRILDINPEYLKKVDLLNLNYYYQDENLGRLLLFYTNDGDMGNMDFDHRIFRQAHKGFLYNYQYKSPDYTINQNQQSRTADFRNLLYYSTFCADNANVIEVDFTTGDDKAAYDVVVSGYKENGQTEQFVKTFVVE